MLCFIPKNKHSLVPRRITLVLHQWRHTVDQTGYSSILLHLYSYRPIFIFISSNDSCNRKKHTKWHTIEYIQVQKFADINMGLFYTLTDLQVHKCQKPNELSFFFAVSWEQVSQLNICRLWKNWTKATFRSTETLQKPRDTNIYTGVLHTRNWNSIDMQQQLQRILYEKCS
jgi:hypothetical protein